MAPAHNMVFLPQKTSTKEIIPYAVTEGNYQIRNLEIPGWNQVLFGYLVTKHP